MGGLGGFSYDPLLRWGGAGEARDITHAFTTHRGSPTTFACCRQLPCLASGGHYDWHLLATWHLPTGTTTSSAMTRTSMQISPVVLFPQNSSCCMIATSLYDMHSSPCTGTPHTYVGNLTMCARAWTLPCDPCTPHLGLLPHRQDTDVPAHSSRLPCLPPLILCRRLWPLHSPKPLALTQSYACVIVTLCILASWPPIHMRVAFAMHSRAF